MVRNHADRTFETLVQDSAYNISLVSPQGKALWKLQTEGLITGEVMQIDYYNNGKLQYLFTTPGLLHVVDRLGNHIKPFPVRIPEQDIEFVSLVDYDHSKKYRFFVAGVGKNMDV